jgi:hypothetical protein
VPLVYSECQCTFKKCASVVNSIQVYLFTIWAQRGLGDSVCEPKKCVDKHFSYIQFCYDVKCTHTILSPQEQHEVCAYYHLHSILVVFVTHIHNCTKIVKEADS